MPRVSVIIPTYNRAHVVGEAIDSVLAQTYQDFEIIVVDDASTDNTQEVLARHAAHRPDKIRLIRCETNGGAAAARNIGIRASTGEYIAFLDSDDLYLPNRLESAVRFLEEHREYGAAYADALHVYPRSAHPAHLWVAVRGGGRSGWILEDVLKDRLLRTPTTTIRRRTLEAVGPFDDSLVMGHDLDLFWRLARQARIGYVDQVVCTVRVTAGSLVGSAGSAAYEGCVRRTRRALTAWGDLTKRQRRLLQLKLYEDARTCAFHMAREGRSVCARSYRVLALRSALAAGLWIPALKATLALGLGHRAEELRRRLGELPSATLRNVLRRRGRRPAA